MEDSTWCSVLGTLARRIFIFLQPTIGAHHLLQLLVQSIYKHLAERSKAGIILKSQQARVYLSVLGIMIKNVPRKLALKHWIHLGVESCQEVHPVHSVYFQNVVPLSGGDSSDLLPRSGS